MSEICKKFALLASIALAWHDPGHALTSNIAKKHLNSKNPAIVPLLERYLALTSANWDHVHEDISTMERVATWADQIKTENFNTFSNMHFLNVYFENDGVDGVELNLPQCGYEEYDGSTTEDLIKDYVDRDWWGMPRLYKTTASTLKHNGSDRSPYSIDFAIRILSHLVGDSHQPLHTTGYIPLDQCNPQCEDMICLTGGDQGGNFFLIHEEGKEDEGIGGMNNLHAFWDAIGLWFSGYNDEFDSDFLNEKTRELMQLHPATKLVEEGVDLTYNIANVFTESFNLATDVVYKPIIDIFNAGDCDTQHAMLQYDSDLGKYRYFGIDEDYTVQAEEIAKRQVAIAGYRMASEFEKLFESITPSEIEWLEAVETGGFDIEEEPSTPNRAVAVTVAGFAALAASLILF